jgi:predicted permease
VEQDLSEEMDSFEQMLTDENMRRGLPAGDARREARLEMGGAEQVKEAVRDVRTGSLFNNLAAEMRQTMRALRRNPGLTWLSIGMLALGIGGSVSVFSIFYSALLRPLPFAEPDRLVELRETRLARGVNRASFSQANFWDVRAQNHVFTDVGAYKDDEGNLTGSGAAEKVKIAEVSGTFFPLLGVAPVIGRNFSADDVRGGWDNSVVLLGSEFWRTHFAGDANVIGRTLRINGRAYSVIGVLPAGEPFLSAQVYMPFGYRPNSNRGSWEFSVVGRLKPGISTKAAIADLERVGSVLARDYPRDDNGIGFSVLSSRRWIAPENTRKALWLMLGAVCLLLAIACVNVANLLLARGISRQRELAIRTALGAGRGRLIRSVMLESFSLSVGGALAGILLAWFALRSLQVVDTLNIPRLAEANLNAWVLCFGVVVTVLVGVFSGLAPALQAPSSAISKGLREGDHQTGSRIQNRLRSALVTAEVALSVLLLVGAGLLIRSFERLTHVNPGFQTDHRLLFSINFPGSYWENGAGQQFLNRFNERLSALPGVVAAGSVNSRPIVGWDPGMSIDSRFREAKQGGKDVPWASWRIVSPGYLKAAGLKVVRGRDFNDHDQPVWAEKGQPEPQRHVMISERLSRLLFADTDPIGAHVTLWKGQSNRDAEVVAVVSDSRERGLGTGPALTVYIPNGANALTSEFVVHTRVNPLALAPQIRAIAAEIDPNLPVADVRSFDEVVQRSVTPQLFNTVLLCVFGGLALLLAISGIYGVLSYAIGRRTSEIGLRMVLGATAASILRMTVALGMRPVLIGVALGIGASLGLSQYFASLLFGIKPFDAATYAAVIVVLLATALVACYFPGRRAVRTDPAVALRIE